MNELILTALEEIVKKIEELNKKIDIIVDLEKPAVLPEQLGDSSQSKL